MKVRGYLLYAVLFAVAVALAIAAGNRGQPDNRPSIEATGPQGLRALYLYLKESHRPVSALRKSFGDRDAKTRTLVVAAPTARAVSETEVDALRKFVEDGGTLVYLAPRSLDQKALADWLDLKLDGPRLTGATTTSPDAEVQVWLPFGALAGTKTLVLSPEASLAVGLDNALPVAGQGDVGKPGRVSTLWHLALGKGEVWITAGVDLAANARIAQGDNLAFWDHLSQQGPLAFDELHQLPADGPPMSPAAVAFAAQFLLVGLLFAWANGARLGPPRMPPEVRHRASREYLTAFGTLLRRAHVEGELSLAMLQRLRRTLRERLGIPVTLTDEEAGRAVEANTGVPASELLALMDALRAAGEAKLSPRAFLALARRTARVEAALVGRKSGATVKVDSPQRQAV